MLPELYPQSTQFFQASQPSSNVPVVIAIPVRSRLREIYLALGTQTGPGTIGFTQNGSPISGLQSLAIDQTQANTTLVFRPTQLTYFMAGDVLASAPLQIANCAVTAVFDEA